MSCWLLLSFLLNWPRFHHSHLTDAIPGQTDFLADELGKLQDADNAGVKVQIYQTYNSDSSYGRLSCITDEQLGKLQDADKPDAKVRVLNRNYLIIVLSYQWKTR